MMTVLDGPRDGDTFDAGTDTIRLNAQMRRVADVMVDSAWRSLAEIAEITGDPEASISARLRDFRKPRFGGFTVLRRRREGAGLWEYKLALPDDNTRNDLLRCYAWEVIERSEGLTDEEAMDLAGCATAQDECDELRRKGLIEQVVLGGQPQKRPNRVGEPSAVCTITGRGVDVIMKGL